MAEEVGDVVHRPGRQVVEHDHGEALPKEVVTEVGAEEAGSSGDHYTAHVAISTSIGIDPTWLTVQGAMGGCGTGPHTPAGAVTGHVVVLPGHPPTATGTSGVAPEVAPIP